VAAIVYADFGDDARTDDQDVLAQVREFSRILPALGYEIAQVRIGLDLQAAASRLRELRPSLAVNLVESIEGSDALQYLGPALLDHLRIPYTGSPTDAVFLTANKVLAKRIMDGGGVRTPPWMLLADVRSGRTPGDPPWIVKPIGEHASYGIEDDSVVREAATLLRRAERADAASFFVERYVEGREINASLLAGRDGTEVLPLAEIDFSGFPAGKPRIVGYRAKWDERSFEYLHTVRNFDFPPSDDALLVRVREIARAAWRLFGLRGYARVDMRVDSSDTPWVLEVNTNPCLSPDAGFAAAAARAGMALDTLLQGIVESGRSA
jgi:D-alanine-D-alanine ligase